jgi:hypothetical protein
MKLTTVPRFETPVGSGTTWACTREAAITMQIACTMKELIRVPRALGCINRVDAKKTQPQRKQKIERRDFTQP